LAGNPYLSPRFGYHQGFNEFHDFLDSTLPGECIAPTTPSKKLLSDLNRRMQAVSHRTHLTATAYDELYFWYCQLCSRREAVSMDQLRRYPAADVMVDRASSWLRNLGDEPFFLWVHLMDPHHPYYPPQEALSSLGTSNISARRARFLNSFWKRTDIGPQRLQRYRVEILSLYDAGVYWADKQISLLVSALQHLQRWDETVFVVTADHGEEFLEHGARYHAPMSLSEQLIHVPLLLRAPKLLGRRLSQGPFSMIHLAPTLLEAVGAAVPDSFQGRSRWEDISMGNLPNEAAIAECVEACNNPFRVDDRIRPRLLVIRDREYKLVIHFSNKSDCLYDLKNDPGECSPLPTGVLTSERVRLLKLARVHLQNSRRSRNTAFAVRARLRELQQSTGSKPEQAPASPVAG